MFRIVEGQLGSALLSLNSLYPFLWKMELGCPWSCDVDSNECEKRFPSGVRRVLEWKRFGIPKRGGFEPAVHLFDQLSVGLDVQSLWNRPLVC